MIRAYGAAWAGTGLVGHLAPQALEDPQHLVQVVHRVDVELRGGLGLGRLELHRGHEEDGRPRPLHGDRLLGHAADVADIAVLVDRARGGDDPVAGEAPAAQLVDDAERHGQAGGRAADVLRVHRDLDGELPVLLRLRAECRGTRSAWSARRSRCRPGPWGACRASPTWARSGPLTNWPTSLMEDSSTLSATLVPGVSPCSASMREQSVGVGVAFTAVITCATCNVEAGRRTGLRSRRSSAPALVEVTV